MRIGLFCFIYIVDEHVISTDGEHRLFEIDGSFSSLDTLITLRLIVKITSVLSTNHAKG